MRASGFCGTRETLICGTRVHVPRRINARDFGTKVFANVCGTMLLLSEMIPARPSARNEAAQREAFEGVQMISICIH